MNLSIDERITARRVLRYLRDLALQEQDVTTADWLQLQAEVLKISLDIERVYKKPPSTGSRLIAAAARTRPKRHN